MKGRFQNSALLNSMFRSRPGQVEAFLKGIGGEVVATLHPGVAGNLVGAAPYADLLSLPPDVQGACLSTLAADRLGAEAAGFGTGGAVDTVSNIVPGGTYVGGSPRSSAPSALQPSLEATCSAATRPRSLSGYCLIAVGSKMGDGESVG